MLSVGLGYRQASRLSARRALTSSRPTPWSLWGLIAGAGLILDYSSPSPFDRRRDRRVTSAIPSMSSDTVPMGWR